MLQEPAIKKDNDLFTDVLDNLPDKYFFDKWYKSKSQVDKNMDNAINHFIDLKYNRSEAQELATKLEKQSKNADDFVMSYEEYPTKEQNDKGYKSKSDFTKTIKKGIKILKGKQYSKDEAQEAVNYIAEHSSKLDFDKNIDKLPDIKNYRKGYKTDDEISDCFNNSVVLLKC